jgi:hypothetical protein
MKTAEKMIRGVEEKKNTIIMLDLDGIERPSIHFNLKTGSGDRDNPLRLNILDIDFSNEDSEEIEIITETFTDSLKLSQEQTQIFWNALRTIQRRRRIEEDEMSHPAISSIITEIQRHTDPQRAQPESTSLLRILVSLTEGQVGEALNSKESTCIEDLLKRNTLIDLSKLRNTRVKKLLISLLLASISQIVKSRVLKQKGNKFYLVLKDDGSILREDKMERNTAQKTLLELKKMGVSLLIIQTSMKQISSYLIEQCQTKICHRLTNSKDIDLAKNMLNLREPEKDAICELSSREALVKTTYSVRPFLIQVFNPDLQLSSSMEDETAAEEDILEIISTAEEETL